MKKVKVNEMREHLAKYLSDTEEGGEIDITKHSRPVARLVSLEPAPPVFPDLSDYRESLNVVKKSPVSETIIDQRNEERY